MTTHPIPADTDLVDLADALRASDLRIGLDEALALRKAKRPRRSNAAHKAIATRRSNFRNVDAFRQGERT